MIDTLKLTKRLTAANMPTAQAEALSEGLAESLKESYVTREFLESQLATRLAALEMRIVLWVVGTVGLATLVNHWWR